MRQIRECIALAMLAISSYTDIREKYIYLVPMIISAAGAALMSVIYALSGPDESAAGVVTGEVIIPAAAGIVLIALSKAAREHIGAGDGYLVASLGMVIGLRSMLCAAAAGIMASLLFAAVFISGNRRHKRIFIPFAPFVLAGYMAVLIYEMH